MFTTFSKREEERRDNDVTFGERCVPTIDANLIQDLSTSGVDLGQIYISIDFSQLGELLRWSLNNEQSPLIS